MPASLVLVEQRDEGRDELSWSRPPLPN